MYIWTLSPALLSTLLLKSDSETHMPRFAAASGTVSVKAGNASLARISNTRSCEQQTIVSHQLQSNRCRAVPAACDMKQSSRPSTTLLSTLLGHSISFLASWLGQRSVAAFVNEYDPL